MAKGSSRNTAPQNDALSQLRGWSYLLLALAHHWSPMYDGTAFWSKHDVV
jgi:hypothetical protein